MSLAADPNGRFNMSRLLIHVEGETEETFVNEVLRSHLLARGFTNVSARIVGNARLRHRRGGIRGWDSVRKDIIRHLREDPGAFSTMMVDYYALPQTGPGAWPGRQAASTLAQEFKAITVEEALTEDIKLSMGNDFYPVRFLPYIVIHEFEGFLFSDCDAFGRALGKPDVVKALQTVRDNFETPEHINDSPITAPSKRVAGIIPSYQKPLMGTLAILEIGLDKIRAECPHFTKWLCDLEALPH
jgi:hypothetical protein